MPKLKPLQQDWTSTKQASRFGLRSPPIQVARRSSCICSTPRSRLFTNSSSSSARTKANRPKDADDPGEEHLFDSGLSSIGNWLMDIVVIAMIAVVAGAILKWAYMAIFHK